MALTSPRGCASTWVAVGTGLGPDSRVASRRQQEWGCVTSEGRWGRHRAFWLACWRTFLWSLGYWLHWSQLPQSLQKDPWRGPAITPEMEREMATRPRSPGHHRNAAAGEPLTQAVPPAHLELLTRGNCKRFNNNALFKPVGLGLICCADWGGGTTLRARPCLPGFLGAFYLLLRKVCFEVIALFLSSFTSWCFCLTDIIWKSHL